jgi:glycolate oxidase FAD binding subunit
MPGESPYESVQTPSDANAVAGAVRAAASEGLALYPIGGGTTQTSRETSRPGIRLSTAKLNHLIDYPADDMTITVEAGMTVAELSRLLAEKRQWLPVDVAFPDRVTVGGAIATNAAGPRRYAYGTMRDYLLGFTAVDGTGMVFSGGGRVVKNAAGYNLCRLMAGSRGTLGIITQATLMVRPLPEAAALLACDLPDFALAETLLASLVRLPVNPVAIELSAGRQHDGSPLLGPVTGSNVCRLCVGFEGQSAEVEWMLNKLHAEWMSLGMISPVLIPELETDAFWRWMAQCPADATIGVLPSELVANVRELLESSPDCAIQARAGNGVIRVKCRPTDDASSDLSLAAASTRQESDEQGIPLPEVRVMRAIKERFDPANILNPGLLGN